MKLLLLLISVVGLTFVSNGQREANNWYFGRRAALNFSGGFPIPVFNSQMHAPEGCASISDRNGNLLFYSDGLFIWNRQHQRMLYNNNLAFIGDNGDGTQTGVIIPWPAHDSLYFVFSIGQLGGNLYYSVVNMNRNGGLGEVVASKVLLLPEVCEKLTAVKHCNKKDFWAITHKFNSDEYYSYYISSAGISSSPVISPTGNSILNSNGQQFERTMGYLKNSPDGRLLAAAHYDNDYIELTDFNTTNGVVSNPRKLLVIPTVVPDYGGAYGVEFSPDSKLLYATSNYFTGTLDTSVLYQFDVTQGTETAIQGSRQFIHGSEYAINSMLGLQLGPDKKIYVAKTISTISVINQPNVIGAGCQFVSDQVNLDDGSGQHGGGFGLPNFVQSYLYAPIIAAGNCQFSNISFSLDNLVGASGVEWNFGDPATGANNISTSFTPTHIFSQQGPYEVTAIIQYTNGCGADTVHKLVHAGPFQVFLGNDTTICQGDTLSLAMNIPNTSNLWSNNSSGPTLKIFQSGTYWIRTVIGDCVASDTINVTVRSLPAFTLGTDQVICSNQTTTLTPSPNPVGVSYSWNTGETTASISPSTNGDYWLKITENGYGCAYADTVNVSFKTLPAYSLGPDAVICEKDTLVLNATIPGAAIYNWNTGSANPAIKVFQQGIYWADVTQDNCTYRDSITVTTKPLPVVNLGMDVTLCEDETLVLDAQNPGSDFLWQNGSTDQTFTVEQTGIYRVKVTSNGCSSSDTVNIGYILRPRFSLGPDKTICPGQEIVLSPGGSGMSYTWQNGSTSPVFTVNDIGLYYVDVSNRCGSKRDSILISKGICDLYVPSGFSPNNDGRNDIFKALGSPQLKEFRLTIYNRWGEIVFYTKDISQGWNGKLKNKDADTGVYIWVIAYKTLSDVSSQVLKGTMVLIR